MPVTTCPHCEEGIDSLTRTGDKKYSCGKCNMVIKYDDVQPHLDEMEVIDKRGGGDSNESSSSDGGGGGGGSPDAAPQISSEPNQTPPDVNTGASLNEREKIYQRGTDGLREIKKNRLKQWLAETEGVGAQTENRITMVFERNDSVHKNPHVLYNLLDDEIGASASYLNTMVQDIFAPEEEHSDLLTSQGYTPWHARSGQGGNMQANMGQGGPMNATGATNFNPNQQAQQQQGQPNRQQQNQQQSQGSAGDDSISRQEAEMMVRQATAQANQQNERGALMSGLSDGANKAIEEAASNAGGLFGTMQRVVDEALVEYARENPEWVIENMDILQKILGATDDPDESSGGGTTRQSQEDQKVDNALENLGQSQGGGQDPSRNTQTQQHTNQQPQQTQTQQNTRNTTPQERNPDLNDEMMGESEFEPEFDTDNFGAEEQDNTAETQSAEPEVNNKQPDNTTEEVKDSADEEQEDGFDEIFGDITEEQ